MSTSRLVITIASAALIAACDNKSPAPPPSSGSSSMPAPSSSMLGKTRDMAKDVAKGISQGGAAGKQAAMDEAQDRFEAAQARLSRLRTKREDVPGSKKAPFDDALSAAEEQLGKARELLPKASDSDLHELSKSTSALAQAITAAEKQLDTAASFVQD